MRCRPAARSARGLAGEQHAVGRQRQIANRRTRREQLDELGQIAAQQRLPAGEPHAVDAERRRTRRRARAISSKSRMLSRGSQT